MLMSEPLAATVPLLTWAPPIGNESKLQRMPAAVSDIQLSYAVQQVLAPGHRAAEQAALGRCAVCECEALGFHKLVRHLPRTAYPI